MGHQRALTRSVSVITVAACLAAAGIVFSHPADASFHLMKIVEVYQGGQQNSEFIELQMYSNGQNAVSGKTVKVFGENGAETGSFTFPNNMSNGDNQAHILLATEAAEFEFGVEADLDITEAMSAFGGAVCFEDIDCVAWGNYAGDKSQTGDPFSPQDGLEANQSMTRDTSGGSNPSRLDGADDTNDSAADFDHAQPTPTSNRSSDPSPTGSESPSSSPTEPHGDPPNADATITRPRWKKTYAARDLLTFKGTASHSDEGQDFSVFIALRRKMKSGACKWLTRGGGFEKDGCKRADQHELKAKGQDRWSYELDGPLRSSKRGRISGYTLFARGECNCSPFQGRGDKHPFEIR